MNSQHKSKASHQAWHWDTLGDFLQDVHQDGRGGTCAAHVAVTSGLVVSAAGNGHALDDGLWKEGVRGFGVGSQSEGLLSSAAESLAGFLPSFCFSHNVP